jgi:glycosyltransferase involved in cell wall biosynthesis
MNPPAAIAAAAVRELLSYDLGPAARPAARLLWTAARALLALPSTAANAAGVRLMMRLHTAALSPVIDDKVTDWLSRGLRDQRGRAQEIDDLFDQTIAEGVAAFKAAPNPEPDRLIGSRIFVVKSAHSGERGVLLIDYQYVFPLLAGLFDINRIVDRYDLVLEPSWAGACTPEILLFTRLSRPVYVQTIEPRDHRFLNALDSNLRVVPLAANWWLDPGPEPPVGERDIDVVMVAAWADIKRHWRVFKALKKLRLSGHRLKVVLVGYKYDRTRQDIESLAAHFGLQDQVTTYERIPQPEVAALLARSKVHVLWSRRECANRAIIEAMLADVPVLVREGLTFGHRYPYINDQTGRFVAERDLADALLDMTRHRGSFSPREWVVRHMTCEQSTRVLESQLRREAIVRGEPWTTGLVVRSSALDTQRYLEPSDRETLNADYEFLRTTVRQ